MKRKTEKEVEDHAKNIVFHAVTKVLERIASGDVTDDELFDFWKASACANATRAAVLEAASGFTNKELNSLDALANKIFLEMFSQGAPEVVK